MDEYLARIVDDELDELLASCAAVSIEGARGVGKTETALRRANTVHRLDDPAQAEILSADFSQATSGAPPILIDEWQRIPSSWDAVRRAVDDGASAAQFLLTGSASPTDAPTHTGAGRIVTVRMRPMSLPERSLSDPTVRLKDLLSGSRPSIGGSTSLRLNDYAEEIIKSGFPDIRRHQGRARNLHLDSYIDLVLEHDIDDQGRIVRNRPALRRWLTAYAAASSTCASHEKLRRAAASGDGDTSARSTTIPYRDALERLWIIEEVPAWLPTRNHLRQLAAAPVHQLVDPALAARLLGVGVDGLISGSAGRWDAIPRDGTLLGALFESLVTQTVRACAQANEARVSHLRTHGGRHEVDLVVERPDGCVAAFEVKLAATVNSDDVRHLHWLAGQVGDNLVDAAVITTGPAAYRRPDGIAVIPAALLTA